MCREKLGRKPIREISTLLAALCRRSPERKEAADGHVHDRVLVPGLRGDLPGDVASATGRLEAARPVLPNNAADDGEGEAHQHPGAQQQQHGGGRQGLRGAAPPVDGVDHAPRQEERRWEEKETYDKMSDNEWMHVA